MGHSNNFTTLSLQVKNSTNLTPPDTKRPDPGTSKHNWCLRMPGRRCIDVFQVGHEGDLTFSPDRHLLNQVAVATYLKVIEVQSPRHTQTSSMCRATINRFRCSARRQVDGVVDCEARKLWSSYLVAYMLVTQLSWRLLRQRDQMQVAL